MNKTTRFPHNRLSHAIAIALTTAISGPAMAGTGSCGNGTTVISSAATTACVLEDGDSLEISDSGSIQITTLEAAVYSSGMPTIGSVNNKGLIKSASTSTWGTGIFLQDTTVTGDVNNSGTIESHYTAISLGDVGGDVINSGSIVSDSGTGIRSYKYGTTNKIAGDVVNSGTIESHYTGILLTDVGGDVINSGHIDAESYSGMYLYGEIGGDIVNSGTIESHSYGIGVASFHGLPGTSSVGGDIINSGTISSYYQALYIEDSNIGGSIINTGTMRSDDDGIYLYDSTVGGKIDNSGLIQAGDGYEGIYVYDATVTGGIHNSGSIVALGSGTAIHYESPNGVIHNSGKISGNAAILGDKDMTLNLYAGSNISGTIDLDNSGTDVAGDVVNILYSGNTTLTVVGAETVNFLGGGIVSGTTIISVDTTAPAAQGIASASLSNSVHSTVSQRMAYKPPLQPVQVASLTLSPSMLFQERKPVAWIQAFGGKRERDDDGDIVAYDHGHYGVNIGYEWDAKKRRVGLMAGFASSDVESDIISFETEADSFFVGGYGHFNLGSVNLTASLIGGYSDYDNKRYVYDNINGLETASSDFDGTFLSPSVTLSAGYLLKDDIELRPSFSLAYNVAWMDSYTETGTTRSNLTIDDTKAQTLSTRLQLAFAKQPSQQSEVEVRAGILSRHTDNDNIQATLAGNGSSFSSVGDDNKIGGYVGFNYRIATKDNLSLVADVEASFSKDETYLDGQLSLEYKF
ncbi:MAG: autotransporter domain-containing protein [Gammaproteobacteria bacterium]|nr:autotransporter domain-containing protein [Gammaproteobacteria bacterium]